MHLRASHLPASISRIAFDPSARAGEMKLDFEEFVAMQPMRVRELHTRDTLREWYEAADEDHSGKLTINEFFSWSLNSSQVGGASVLERIFRKYDVDNSGSIGKDEFKRMAYDLGFGHMAHEAFAVLDNDRSGSITYREVLAALKKDVPFNLCVNRFLTRAPRPLLAQMCHLYGPSL
jgi:Ca2+-binding EF-hand superfamily protein